MSRHSTFRIAVRRFPPFEAAIRVQWADYEAHAHTGLTLDLVSLDLHELEDALFHSGGMARGDWDVAFVNTDWIAAMHALGAAADLAPALAAEPPPDYPAGWPESLLRLQRVGGQVLGVPYHDGPECLIYRRDLFDDPGLRARYYQRFFRPLVPPATWADFHRTACFFRDSSRELFGTVFAGLPDGHNTVYDFLLQLWTRGGELLTADGKPHFHTPAALQALTFYREILSDRNALPPGCATLDSVAAGALFAEGKLAMMINWFGFAAHAHTAAISAVRGLVDIAPIPAGDGGHSVSLNVYWLLALASGSPHGAHAWNFLRHTQSPAMDLLTSELGAIGCRRSTWADPALNREIPFYGRLEQLHEHAREIPQRADWPSLAATIDRLMTGAASTQTDIATLLDQADAEWR